MASSSAEGVRTAPALKMTRTTLLVGNLPPGATCDELEANLVMAFSPFGEVVECEVIEDAQGGARGFAFLRMRDSRQARAAKHDLDGTLQELQVFDGARVLSLGITGIYLNNLNLGLTYAIYDGGGLTYLLSDRDNIALTLKYSF